MVKEEAWLDRPEEGIEKIHGLKSGQLFSFPFAALSTTWLSRLGFSSLFKVQEDTVFILTNFFESLPQKKS